MTISNALTMGGNVAMDVNHTTGTSDRVTGVTTLSYGGTLTVTNLAGTLAAGDSFTLFSATSYTGSFSAFNLPVLASGLVWDTSALATNGTIKVVSGASPSVATPAAATLLAGNSTASLSVFGADPGGEANLIYNWSATGPAGVSFSTNGSNAAKNATATFTAAGAYTFTVTITDASNLSTAASVGLSVAQTLTTIAVVPATAAVGSHAALQFAATGYDQFATAMLTQPSINWTVGTGGGGINGSTGLYTASYASGSATITASSGSILGNAVALTVTDAPPSVATPASATPSPATGATATLSVLGADSDGGGESNLTYTWATIGTPPAAVGFSASGTNAAKNTTATFTKAGNYSFLVTITDQGGLSTTSSVNLTMNQTLTGVAVSPTSASITAGATQQFTATAYDQFGAAISNQSFTWAIATGAGSINGTSGVYTPPYAPASATVQATDSGVTSNSAAVTVAGQAQWNSVADASWNAAGSWADSITSTAIAAPGTRGIAGDTVLFAAATGGAARLDGASPTLAGITFNNSTTSYTITQGSGGNLTLLAGGGAAVNVIAGNHSIGAPLVIASTVNFSENAGTKLTIGGNISGGGSLTKSGAGVVELSGTNTFGGGTIVQSGTLIVQQRQFVARRRQPDDRQRQLFLRSDGDQPRGSRFGSSGQHHHFLRRRRSLQPSLGRCLNGNRRFPRSRSPHARLYRTKLQHWRSRALASPPRCYFAADRPALNPAIPTPSPTRVPASATRSSWTTAAARILPTLAPPFIGRGS